METTKPKQSSILAFFKGFASAFDMTGQTLLDDLPDLSSGLDRDRQAIAGDWQRIGDDMRKVMGQAANGR
jgi:hypothetical protein